MTRPQPYRPDGTRVAFIDYATGRGVLDTGAPVPVTYTPKRGRMPLAALLETARAAGVRRVLLTGKRPPERWLEDQAEGWRPDPRGHYFDATDPTGRFIGPTDQDRVELRRTAAWLGEGAYTPRQAREAFALLVSALRAVARDRVGLMASPAATGQSLWAASLPEQWDGAQLPEELMILTRKSSPQHRMEVLGHCYKGCDAHLDAPRGKLPELHYLDGRLMYLACTRGRLAAPGRKLTAEQAEDLLTTNPYARARLYGAFKVPDGWDGPGLLMEPHPDGSHWHAPNRPGYLGYTWADSLEWWEARRQGWHVGMEGGGYQFHGPPVLETWTARVLRMRETVQAADADDTTKDLAAAAVRMMALTTIGAFHGTGRDRTVVADGPSAIPDGVKDWQVRPDGTVVYRVPQTLTGNAAAFAHPELSSQVWALARHRVLQAMTSLPREAVVGVWGDAVYLDRDPGWEDDGKVGRLRSKGHLDGPLTRPTDLTGLNRLRVRMGDT